MDSLAGSGLVNVEVPQQETVYTVCLYCLPIMSIRLEGYQAHLWPGPAMILPGCFRHDSEASIVRNHGRVILLLSIMLFLDFTLDLHKNSVWKRLSVMTKAGDFSVLQCKRNCKYVCGWIMELGFGVREPLQSESLWFICTKQINKVRLWGCYLTRPEQRWIKMCYLYASFMSSDSPVTRTSHEAAANPMKLWQPS